MDTRMGPIDRTVRAWLGWFFCWQTLQAYPVAGSQVAWGCVLWPAIALIGCVDLWRYCQRRWRHAEAAGVAGLASAAATTLGITIFHAQIWWHDSLPLGLPGARWIHPPPTMARTLQTLHANIRREAGQLFSLPGMFSFNLWSGHPTPTTANVTHWFSLLDPSRQNEIIRSLEQDPKAVLIVNRGHLKYLYTTGFAPTGALNDYLRATFVPVLRLETYDLCVKQGRSIKACETFGISGDKLIARVLSPAAPCPLFLAESDRPDAKTIPLDSAIWTREGDLWRIEASLPAENIPWPAAFLIARTAKGDILWMRNALPVQ
jgi:hypothetical protein